MPESVGIPGTPACAGVLCVGLRNTSEHSGLWPLVGVIYTLCLYKITILGDEQEAAEGFEAVGPQPGAWKGKCSIFPGAAEGLLAMGEHCLQRRFSTSAPQLFCPLLWQLLSEVLHKKWGICSWWIRRALHALQLMEVDIRVIAHRKCVFSLCEALENVLSHHIEW